MADDMAKVTFIEPSGNERTREGLGDGQTVMELARANGIEGITADCGGACACATCHCYIAAEWRDAVGAPDDVEEMTLDMAPNLRPESRLTCQIQLRPELDGLRVTVAPQ
jgi:2Fe-2S ferredoxin